MLEEEFEKLNLKSAKPFLKWVGGKTQIIDSIIDNFPDKINTYYEPFLGGGSVLIEFLNTKPSPKQICVSDINWSLINCYKRVKKNCDELIAYLENIKEEYDSSPMIKSEVKREKITIQDTIEKAKAKGKHHVYYYYRQRYNNLNKDRTKENKIELAGLFIFLNKTCFRGLYREAKNGFNVPFGNYENPQICDVENFKLLNKLFNDYDVQFSVKSFDITIKKTNKRDFVYLDPPYYPEKETSFVDYNEGGFSEDNHNKLIEICKKLPCKFLLSNSNTDFIKEGLKEFNVKEILCKRHINAKKPDSTAYEVLIANYVIKTSKE